MVMFPFLWLPFLARYTASQPPSGRADRTNMFGGFTDMFPHQQWEKRKFWELWEEAARRPPSSSLLNGNQIAQAHIATLYG